MCLECSSADNRVLNAAGDECNCDASNKFSEGTGNDDGYCVCDSAKFLVMNDDNNACVCNAEGMFILNETTKLCECNASDNFVLATDDLTCECNSNANFFMNDNSGACEKCDPEANKAWNSADSLCECNAATFHFENP
jgi:hypothetical protein